MKPRLAAAILFLLMLAASLIVFKPGRSYAVQDRDAIMASSSPQHWTGTDQLGRDRTVRISAALLISFAGATAASAVATAIAAAVGTLAAFSPKVVAFLLMLASDLFLTLPWLFLLMLVRSGLPLTTSPMHSAAITFIILAFLGWSACARTVYSGATNLRASEWMMQGRASGLRPVQLTRLHLLPHLRTLLLPQFLLCIPAFIVAEANLGTLGLGIAEPLPSWGTMLLELDNSALLARSSWVYLPIALLVAVLLLLESFAVEV
ncbi:ABC transporter permease subunit [Granulicella sibirica]|uniref:Oligopeptide transport system permease protein OppC n=1 Tax=Granulicella sibirica TaxID=2479048 RepID=A0A4Q0T146_9BACT|nr:ABC transporter permease subunit [Granulicella sibirica]RXH57343.1 Oligopeptide transport system permease protein OppC [Granulicella sibirica]